MNINNSSNSYYKAVFKKSFLLPKYWHKWLLVLLIFILAYIPFRIRDRIANKLGKWFGKKIKKQRKRAYLNLTACFPEWSEDKKNHVIDEMIILACQVFLSIGEMAFRSKSFLQKRTEYIGLDYIIEQHNANKNIILLVPHSWSVDVISIVLNTYNLPMVGMYKPHPDPFFDWLWTHMRERFGGEMFARQNGIKPFLMKVKQGYIGHYSADEDYGEKSSEFVDFFATYKATLKGLHKLTKISNSIVIPAFTRYDAIKGKYQVEVHPAMKLTGDSIGDARAVNEEMESFIIKQPEQYMWILRILTTRKSGDSNIY